MTQIVLGAIIALMGAAVGYGVKKPNTKALNDRVARLEHNVEFVARGLNDLQMMQLRGRPPAPVPMPLPAAPRPNENISMPPTEPEWVRQARAQLQRGGVAPDQMAEAMRQMALMAQAENRL
ncbi:hypothetical protein VZG28_05155 [Synechococcus elongatus IITB4]|uniref:hypothetical protein n=1 Tax=Synechococcus elongatus TaxID=32046 RepID=UPI0030D46AEC